MSTAFEKNVDALQALFGARALAQRLSATRIAIRAARSSMEPSGKLLRAFLVDSLARLWPNIDFSGPNSEMDMAFALNAADSGDLPGGGFREAWEPPYDVVLDIGEPDARWTECRTLQLGADGWLSKIGPQALCGPSRNPVGPAYCGAMAAAQVFLHVFREELADTEPEHLQEWTFDTRTICGGHDLELAPLDFSETHILGCGAVTHGLTAVLEFWPAELIGQLNLVDPDKYTATNGQRYAQMWRSSAGRWKVDQLASRLESRRPNLRVQSHRTDLNSYCQNRGFDSPLYRVITGLDSEEARRHAGLKLPIHAVNMWTAGHRIGAGRYTSGPDAACLVCEYPERLAGTIDETALLHTQTGLRPDVIRELLDSSRALTESEAALISAARSVPREALEGLPLRSALPVLCATGSVVMKESQERADVPFAFSSLLAGVAGFVMLLKDLQSSGVSEGWVQNVLLAPNENQWALRPRKSDCVCCGT
jgi:hypothetical protein